MVSGSAAAHVGAAREVDGGRGGAVLDAALEGPHGPIAGTARILQTLKEGASCTAAGATAGADTSIQWAQLGAAPPGEADPGTRVDAQRRPSAFRARVGERRRPPAAHLFDEFVDAFMALPCGAARAGAARAGAAREQRGGGPCGVACRKWCPLGHALRAPVHHADVVLTCDGCKASLPPGVSRVSCEACDYDLCAPCGVARE